VSSYDGSYELVRPKDALSSSSASVAASVSSENSNNHGNNNSNNNGNNPNSNPNTSTYTDNSSKNNDNNSSNSTTSSSGALAHDEELRPLFDLSLAPILDFAPSAETLDPSILISQVRH
jgi:hypothetical protein